MVEFLNSRDYSIVQLKGMPPLIRTGYKDFREHTMAMIEYFFDEYTEVSFIKERAPMGAPTFIKKDIIQKPLRNLNELSFYSFYPNIILNLYIQGEVEFSIKEHAELFSFMVKELVEIEKHPDITTDSKHLLRFMKNYLYGASNIESHIIKLGISNIEKIVPYYQDTLQELFDTHPNVIYLDVDIIYYHPDDRYDVEGFIKKLDLPYGIKEDINGFFLAKKRYIADIDGDIIVRGCNDPRKPGYRKNPPKFAAVETGLKLLEDMQMTRKLNKLICLSQTK